MVTCSCRKLNLGINLAAVVVGVALGFLLRQLDTSPFALFWVGLAGRLYIRFLIMMIVPFAVSSIISGTATLDLSVEGKFGFILIGLVILSNMISAATGLTFIYLAFQREANGTTAFHSSAGDYSALSVALLRNMVPNNIISISFQKVSHMRSPDVVTNTSHMDSDAYNIIEHYEPTPNMLGLLVLSVIFGVTAGIYKEKTQPLIMFCEALSTICLHILSALSWVQPISTVCLTASAIGALADLSDTFISLCLFLGTLGVAVVLHQCVVLPVMVLLAGSVRNPFLLMTLGRRAWFLVFSTANSVLAVPELFRVCELLSMDLAQVELGVPLALLTNTSGGGIYVCMATIVLAHFQGIQLSITQYFIVGILTMSTMASISAVSNGAIGGLLIVTSSMGLSSAHIGLLVAVECIADRLRSPCNIMSTLTCVYAADRFSKRLKKKSPPAPSPSPNVVVVGMEGVSMTTI